jgi:hypothetical protein
MDGRKLKLFFLPISDEGGKFTICKKIDVILADKSNFLLLLLLLISHYACDIES